MTINEMFDELENKVRDTYIVTLKYKYDFEENYIIENHILEYDSLDDSYVWLDDWYEGQTDIEVLGYMPLGDVETLPSVKPQQKNEDMGEVSDGYHTFNQLYHQRAILFATIVNQNKDRAWKSYKHEDGKYCFDKDGEWFIVGIDTPKGSYTYHYSKEYWDYFDCEELECGKPWDGHTEEDVIRLLSLPSVKPQQPRWIPVSERLPEESGRCLVTYERYSQFYTDVAMFDMNQKGNHGFFPIFYIIAWAYLPAPYQPPTMMCEEN